MSPRVSALVACSLEVSADVCETDDDFRALEGLSAAVETLGVAGVLRAIADAGLGVVDMTADNGPTFDIGIAAAKELRELAETLTKIADRADRVG